MFSKSKKANKASNHIVAVLIYLESKEDEPKLVIL